MKKTATKPMGRNNYLKITIQTVESNYQQYLYR